ncbi:hypothetical protein WJX72_007831 [[Myrmecia] bisecta]|uniref:Uncharacterized protein n=1 Tax=[Myrmecia] bisecta TaxID=41462 RepID=A0AAW1QBV1_9CHLO
MDEATSRPGWLHALTHTDSFFRPCRRCSHLSHGREVTVNFFDVDDVQQPEACSLCVAERDAAGHRCLQIRRSSYHDVLKTQDISRLVDISGVQTYVINQSRVIFIKRRPQPRPVKGAPGMSQCTMCARHLQDVNLFCSLQCKLDVASDVDVELSSPAVSSPCSSSISQSPPRTPTQVDRLRGCARKMDSFCPAGEECHGCKRRKRASPHRSPLQ